jgi:methylglutaconyl-CoA hydratase
MSDVLKVVRSGRVAEVVLNRPDVRNAFNGELMGALIDAFTALGADAGVHVIVLRGEGPAFCAGADLGWMKQTVTWTTAENEADARRLAGLFEAIDSCPKPVVGQIHGAVRGGGVGLVAACDIPIASSDATFAFTEVRLGLAPAVISPYCVRRIGAARARELFLTGATFDAARARDMGLLADVELNLQALAERVAGTVSQLLAGGPSALAACKHLARTVASLPSEEALATTSALIARLRKSDEAQEGMRAFLTKDKPSWMK